MFVLTNTAGASATTPPASKTTLFVDASGVPSTKDNGGTVTPLLTGPAAALAYQPLDSDLTGIAGLTYAADKSIYYTGSAWATYDLTGVGRTLLAATTQAAQRSSLGLGDAAVQNIGTTGATVPLINGTNLWNGQNTYNNAVTYDYGSTNGIFRFTQISGDPTLFGIRGDFTGSTYGRTDIRFRNGSLRLGAGNPSSGFSPANWFDIMPTAVQPSADNVMDVGTGALRFRTYYGVNSAINTSDARLKTDPRQLREAEFKAASAIARLPAVWRWLNRVHGDENCEPEGKDARKHFGPTVQAAIAVMEANGLDPFAYSFICYDEWEAQEEKWHEWEAKDAVLDDDGNVLEPAVEAGRELIQPAREAGDRYSFRKEELLCFMVSALAAENDVQAAKVEALDARLAALEAKT